MAADPGVGPYGWAAGGGHGPLTRLNGLGADVLINVELMIANGTIIIHTKIITIIMFKYSLFTLSL